MTYLDAITDVPGVRVGHWTSRRAATGCTVVRVGADTSPDAVRDADLVLLCVKTSDTPQAATSAARASTANRAAKRTGSCNAASCVGRRIGGEGSGGANRV